MTRRPPPPNRYIYVVGPQVGLQKVGLATDPRSRLATLQTACPFDLFLHIAVAVPFGDAHAIERGAHRLLARSCVRNEWFEATPAEAIAAVKSAAAPHAMPRHAAQATPTEWRISRAGRSVQTKAVIAAPNARPAQLKPMPLFDFTKSKAADVDEQALVDRALDALLRQMSS